MISLKADRVRYPTGPSRPVHNAGHVVPTGKQGREQKGYFYLLGHFCSTCTQLGACFSGQAGNCMKWSTEGRAQAQLG